MKGGCGDSSNDGNLAALSGSLVQLMQNDDTDGLKAVHDSGEWTDLEMAVDSREGADGNTWYSSALAFASGQSKIGVMGLLIQLGAKTDEERKWHVLPSNQAAAAGSIEGLKLLKENGCNVSAKDSEGNTPVHAC